MTRYKQNRLNDFGVSVVINYVRSFIQQHSTNSNKFEIITTILMQETAQQIRPFTPVKTDCITLDCSIPIASVGQQMNLPKTHQGQLNNNDRHEKE
jgi:hypothetical protein